MDTIFSLTLNKLSTLYTAKLCLIIVKMIKSKIKNFVAEMGTR